MDGSVSCPATTSSTSAPRSRATTRSEPSASGRRSRTRTSRNRTTVSGRRPAWPCGFGGDCRSDAFFEAGTIMDAPTPRCGWRRRRGGSAHNGRSSRPASRRCSSRARSAASPRSAALVLGSSRVRPCSWPSTRAGRGGSSAGISAARDGVTMPSGPEIKASVVVIGYAPADLLARCLAALRAQHAECPDTEVLVVAHPTHQRTALAPLKARFPEFEWLDASAEHNVARMRGLGIARSRGPVVALLEGDCLPQSDWLARLTQLTPSAAVGGAVEPGAFRRALDWAAYFCEFARYMLPLPPAPTHLPGANVAYRRASLPDPTRLEAEGFYETFVNAAIGTGAALASDPTLIVRHERTWRAETVLATRFHHGRGFAALRVRGRPARQRLPYLALAMALPPILVARVLRETVRRRRLIGRAVRAMPWIVALSVGWSLGEFAGYLAGPGASLERWR